MKTIIDNIKNYLVPIIPIVVCIGFILYLVQKMTRFAFYKVDVLYLVEIRIEEILQGLLFIFIFILTLCSGILIYCIKNNRSENIETNFTIISSIRENKYTLASVLILPFILSICIMISYNNKINIDQIKIVFFSYMAFTCVGYAIAYFWNINKKHSLIIKSINMLCCIALFMVLVAFLQYSFESFNKRFTYIETQDGVHVIVSSINGNYITKKAKIENCNNKKEIKIFLDDTILLSPVQHIRLFEAEEISFHSSQKKNETSKK